MAHVTEAPLVFDAAHLERELRGAHALVNTYWVRFPRGGQDFETAVRNSRVLLEAAVRAGIERLVHVSVSNADSSSPLGYYRGKGILEEAVRALGLSHAIVRPTLVVGPSDVLTSNIAWFLRRFPAFALPQGGGCRLQPVTLEDTGRLLADAVEARDSLEIDAAGPEVFTFREFVDLVARACGVRRRIVAVPSWLALAALRLVGLAVGDVVLTRQELEGLMEEKLLSREPPRGTSSVSSWLMAHGPSLGRRYVNDIHRHFGGGSVDPVVMEP